VMAAALARGQPVVPNAAASGRLLSLECSFRLASSPVMTVYLLHLWVGGQSFILSIPGTSRFCKEQAAMPGGFAGLTSRGVSGLVAALLISLRPRDPLCDAVPLRLQPTAGVALGS